MEFPAGIGAADNRQLCIRVTNMPCQQVSTEDMKKHVRLFKGSDQPLDLSVKAFYVLYSLKKNSFKLLTSAIFTVNYSRM